MAKKEPSPQILEIYVSNSARLETEKAKAVPEPKIVEIYMCILNDLEGLYEIPAQLLAMRPAK